MSFLPNRNVLGEDNPLFKRVKPVLLDIACRGIGMSRRRTIAGVAVFSLLMEPFGWIPDVLIKGMHGLLVVVLWIFFRDELSATGLTASTSLSLALVAVYYTTIYSATVSVLQHLVVIATGGEIVRWVCRGYVANAPLRQSMLENDTVQTWLSMMTAVMPVQYRRAYDEYMDLYLDSNDRSKEKRLEDLLDAFEPGSIALD